MLAVLSSCCVKLDNYLVFKGRLASQIWSQNVPEHVFVFFQVLVLKHAYFSSKSVFL